MQLGAVVSAGNGMRIDMCIGVCIGVCVGMRMDMRRACAVHCWKGLVGMIRTCSL